MVNLYKKQILMMSPLILVYSGNKFISMLKGGHLGLAILLNG